MSLKSPLEYRITDGMDAKLASHIGLHPHCIANNTVRQSMIIEPMRLIDKAIG